MTTRTVSLARGALLVAAALSLAACNPTAGKRTGSGDGPTGSAGSSNTPGVATNGAPAAE
ncbi:hypothetical protein [Aureimonas sp. Leaf324]|jgi:hypothetical protein|uniref:hypothetical protein n=1 Tax=Aureimonas sp. Leaf324 TaxID=1736336 RepID=UPI0006FD48AD|nr:hypothetical protein [Aureimonas sp. Leaf324]KQQ80747.1 hypothetical protein ASF65_11055 [Aureimonas sp. Leaf324]